MTTVTDALARIEDALKNAVHNIRTATAEIGMLINKDRREIGLSAKSFTVWKELAVDWHPALHKLMEWLYSRYRGQITFTSGWRKDDSGIHGVLPLRAFDLRSWGFLDPKAVATDINKHWKYNHPLLSKSHLQVCHFHRTVTCLACGNKFEVNPVKGVELATICKDGSKQGCGAGRDKLIDWGPHFHIQVRNETSKREGV